MANSRLKDYDLFLISQTFIAGAKIACEAVRKTFERRGTAVPDGIPAGLTGEFATAWQTRWRGFVRRERMMRVAINFAAVAASLNDFLVPVIRGGDQDDLRWSPGGRWSRR
jgi:hypothetical protein